MSAGQSVVVRVDLMVVKLVGSMVYSSAVDLAGL